MREHGIVIEVKDGRALIEVEPAEGCGTRCSCSAVAGKPGLRRVELEAPEGVQPGAIVTLEVSSGQVAASSAALFLGPPLLFIVGAAVSKPLLGALGIHVNPDVGTMLVGAFGFLVGLAGALLFSRGSSKRRWLTPRIVEVSNAAI
jgi:positive regulator of sigma E activity